MSHSAFYAKLVRDNMLMEFCKAATRRNNNLTQYLGNAFTWSSTDHPEYWTSIGSDYIHMLNDYDIEVIEAHHPELFV